MCYGQEKRFGLQNLQVQQTTGPKYCLLLKNPWNKIIMPAAKTYWRNTIKTTLPENYIPKNTLL